MITHPQKWRETCDPFTLNYHKFQPVKIIGYPHARNDVFYASGIYNGKETMAYIKAARHKDSAIENEVAILSQLDDCIYPKVIDADYKDIPFSVTTDMTGARLSVILGDNSDMRSLLYMEEYGETLGKFHALRLSAPLQADRKFYHCPTWDMLKQLNLLWLSDFFAEPPANAEAVFCHGDFHYANILWENYHISAVLDFELSGYGNRDFDIAWALFCRPGQKFLKTEQERKLFLKGYSKYGSFNANAVRYYMAQSYVYFLSSCDDDLEYCEYIRSWLADNCR